MGNRPWATSLLWLVGSFSEEVAPLHAQAVFEDNFEKCWQLRAIAKVLSPIHSALFNYVLSIVIFPGMRFGGTSTLEAFNIVNS